MLYNRITGECVAEIIAVVLQPSVMMHPSDFGDWGENRTYALLQRLLHKENAYIVKFVASDIGGKVFLFIFYTEKLN